MLLLGGFEGDCCCCSGPLAAPELPFGILAGRLPELSVAAGGSPAAAAPAPTAVSLAILLNNRAKWTAQRGKGRRRGGGGAHPPPLQGPGSPRGAAAPSAAVAVLQPASQQLV